MKNLVISIGLVCFSSLSLAQDSVFDAWCDVHTTVGLRSLAANRIYGDISTSSDDVYRERADWLKSSMDKARARFVERTTKDYWVVDNDASQQWYDRCNAKWPK